MGPIIFSVENWLLSWVKQNRYCVGKPGISQQVKTRFALCSKSKQKCIINFPTLWTSFPAPIECKQVKLYVSVLCGNYSVSVNFNQIRHAWVVGSDFYKILQIYSNRFRGNINRIELLGPWNSLQSFISCQPSSDCMQITFTSQTPLQ